MSKITIQCENCGTLCKIKDGYCKNCWTKLPTEEGQDDFILEGIGQSEWEEFIGKNAQRYTEVFKKNKGKKIFLNMNWSAFFFGINWALYRRMYKVAIIISLITTLITLVFAIFFTIPYAEEIVELNKAIKPYQEYVDSGGETILYDYEGVPYSPDFVQEGGDAKNRLYEIESDIKSKTLFIVPLSCLFWGLFGDLIYKKYIEKNIKNAKGGTSVLSALLWPTLIRFIESILLDLLFLALALVMVIFI